MTKLRGMVVVALIGLMASTGNLLAHRGGDRGGPGGMMKHLRGLDLSEAQKEQIRGLMEDFRADHEDEFAQMKELGTQAREQRKSGDIEGAKATMAQMKELRQSMKGDHEVLRAAVLNVLTAEQRATLEERKEKCQGKRDREVGERGAEARAERGGRADID